MVTLMVLDFSVFCSIKLIKRLQILAVEVFPHLPEVDIKCLDREPICFNLLFPAIRVESDIRFRPLDSSVFVKSCPLLEHFNLLKFNV